MSGRSIAFHPKDTVVSILSAFREKGPMSPTVERDVPLIPRGDIPSASLIEGLVSGYSLFKLADGQTGIAAEPMDWKPDPYQFSALSRTRGPVQAVFSVRNAKGRCELLVIAEGDPLRISGLARSQERGTCDPCSETVGRALLAAGVELGHFAHRFGALLDKAGRMHFVDSCPDRLELADDFSGQTVSRAILPKVLVSDGDFILMDSAIDRNPVSISVKGTLGLFGATGLVIPSHLNVGRDLLVQMSDAAALPQRFSVGRDLNMTMTPIQELPEHFHVGRSIVANGSAIRRLNGGLNVKGDLDLRDCPIVDIPWGIEVGGSLNLAGTSVTRIPPDTVVGGNLMVEDGVHVPQSLRLGGYLMVARPYGYETIRKPPCGP